MRIWSWIILFFIVGNVGCVSSNINKEAESYKEAEVKYQEGHKNRRKLLQQSSNLEAFENDVVLLWEEGLEIDEAHLSMRKDLAKLYFQMAVQYFNEAKNIYLTSNKNNKNWKSQDFSGKAKEKWEKSKHYLGLALRAFKVLRQKGANLTETDLYLGGVYMYLDRYKLAKAHLNSALASGELSPERTKKVNLALQTIERYSRRRSE